MEVVEVEEELEVVDKDAIQPNKVRGYYAAGSPVSRPSVEGSRGGIWAKGELVPWRRAGAIDSDWMLGDD